MFNILGNVDSESKDFLFPLMKQFDFKQPNIIESSKESYVKMAKQLSKKDISVVTKNDFINKKKKNVISDFNDENNEVIKKMSKTIEKGLLMFEDKETLQKVASNLKFEINQEVYFFDKSSFELYESYEINHVKTVKKLGYLKKSFNHFSWDKGVQQRLVENNIIECHVEN